MFQSDKKLCDRQFRDPGGPHVIADMGSENSKHDGCVAVRETEERIAIAIPDAAQQFSIGRIVTGHAMIPLKSIASVDFSGRSQHVIEMEIIGICVDRCRDQPAEMLFFRTYWVQWS